VILPALDKKGANTPTTEGKTYFKADLSGWKFPESPEVFKQVWHNDPVSQGRTNTCWCYSTTSFYESEIKRLSGKEVRLSQMYTVYWEYMERAKYFVETRGEMYFGEGSETNAVARMMAKHGMVPWESYKDVPGGLPFPDHEKMFKELDGYLKSVKERNAWNGKEVESTVQSILEHYMGVPPTEVVVGNKHMTPVEYMQKELKLVPGDYVNLMSLMEKPYYQRAEYDVPDNWWNSEDYINIPLDDFMKSIQTAVQSGYSISIGGDVSETGMDRDYQVAVVPTFDIPSEYIDESARQFRFNNGTTTDDHAMHIVGITQQDGATWYLVKDSGSGSRTCGENAKNFGYFYFHEDYIKLKMMTATVHKDAVKDLIERVKG
jgi:bleomycin hydrolase